MVGLSDLSVLMFNQCDEHGIPGDQRLISMLSMY